MGSDFTGQIVPDCDLCGFCDLLTLGQNVMNFLVFFAVVVAILMIVYAGFLYLSSATNINQVSKAKKVLGAAIIGLILTLAAWLIVNLIMPQLLDTSFGSPWTLPGCSGAATNP